MLKWERWWFDSPLKPVGKASSVVCGNFVIAFSSCPFFTSVNLANYDFILIISDNLDIHLF